MGGDVVRWSIPSVACRRCTGFGFLDWQWRVASGEELHAPDFRLWVAPGESRQGAESAMALLGWADVNRGSASGVELKGAGKPRGDVGRMLDNGTKDWAVCHFCWVRDG